MEAFPLSLWKTIGILNIGCLSVNILNANIFLYSICHVFNLFFFFFFNPAGLPVFSLLLPLLILVLAQHF